ncbi:A24 family peptidase [Gracilibacillus halophilus YIM-C55.5]|uniref:A24 family peptidase n=1 Tax=Gracilibacillus halophilus YIM-C55.5 TaxID=1308866 RepID=N4WP96_9BACI|nr:A24 family peptidase [Gracilibacillus halophilus]ENH97947.1 A24 family peptidase [Gracilibacillus halophilus YIM-C55.5]
MEVFLMVILFVLGLCFGSFFNVVGLRIPRNEFLSTPYSVCPNCEERLHWRELVPVVSYLIQKGNCKHCHASISSIYPVIELLTGILFVASYLVTDSYVELITVLVFCSLFLIIIVTDLTYMIIPNRILISFLPLFLLMRIISPLDPWWSSIVGSIVGYLIIAFVIAISKGGMGAGDMKLFALIGVFVGFPSIFLTIFLATIYGLLFSLVMLLRSKFSVSKVIPFGPAIVLAGLTVYLYSNQIIKWYGSLTSILLYQ